MKCYSYVVARDYGFAPNPFGPFCTLATCKPAIRKSASTGDWVIGTGAARLHGSRNLVFAMLVTGKLSYNEYWTDPRFLYKRPVMNGSLKKMYGDNIYVCTNNTWHQADSHHSREDGSPNIRNVRRDTTQPYVLISEHFYYFGGNAVPIPAKFIDGKYSIVKKGRGYLCNNPEVFCRAFLQWLQQKYEPVYHGNPAQFTKFDRYDGG